MMLGIPQVHYGTGRHFAYFHDPEKVSRGLYYNFISPPINIMGVFFVKVSIGLFLLRVTSSSFFRKLIWSMQVFMVVYTIGVICTSYSPSEAFSVGWY